MRWGLAAVALAAGTAVGAPKVAVHPLEVLGGDAKAVEQSRSDFLVAAAGLPIQMSAPTLVEEVLATLPGQSCVERPGCLEKLCAETRATYAVLATLRLEGPRFLASATVVAADGTVVKTAEAEAKKDLFTARTPQVQKIFAVLFEQLQLGALPAALPPKQVVVTEPVPAAPPPVVVVPKPAPAPSAETPPLRIAGLVVGGVAVATALGGAAYAITGLTLREDVARLAPNGVLRNEASAIAKARALDEHYANLTGVFGAAGFVAATSAVMLIISGASGSGSATSVALAPVEGGAVLGVGGRF